MGILVRKCACGKDLGTGNTWETCVGCGRPFCLECVTAGCEVVATGAKGFACPQCLQENRAIRRPGAAAQAVHEVSQELHGVVGQLQAVMTQVRTDILPLVVEAKALVQETSSGLAPRMHQLVSQDVVPVVREIDAVVAKVNTVAARLQPVTENLLATSGNLIRVGVSIEKAVEAAPDATTPLANAVDGLKRDVLPRADALLARIEVLGARFRAPLWVLVIGAVASMGACGAGVLIHAVR